MCFSGIECWPASHTSTALSRDATKFSDGDFSSRALLWPISLAGKGDGGGHGRGAVSVGMVSRT